MKSKNILVCPFHNKKLVKRSASIIHGISSDTYHCPEWDRKNCQYSVDVRMSLKESVSLIPKKRRAEIEVMVNKHFKKFGLMKK